MGEIKKKEKKERKLYYHLAVSLNTYLKFKKAKQELEDKINLEEKIHKKITYDELLIKLLNEVNK